MSGELITIWGVGAALAGADPNQQSWAAARHGAAGWERIGGLESLDSQDELEELPTPWEMD